jgi:lipopolysaccharide biosynthesis glycosyltransferase
MFIVSIADEKFVPLYAAMLHSCGLFNPDARHGLIDAGITEQTRQRLLDFAKQKTIDLQIVSRPDLNKQIADLPKWQNFLCLFASEIFSRESRLLYLDSDITVLGKLDELFGMDLEGCPLAAMIDSVDETIRTETIAHGIDFGDTYFNAGVMVIDTGAWKRLDITNAALAYWRSKRSRMKFNDQAALNGVLRGNFKRLDHKWNFYNPHDYKADEDIRILHHTYYERPWKSEDAPFHALHKYHRSQTPWPLPRTITPFHVRLRDEKRRLLGKLGVKKYRDFYETTCRRGAMRDELGKASLSAARSLSGADVSLSKGKE